MEANDAEVAALLALAGIDGIGPAALLHIHRGEGAEHALESLAGDQPGRSPELAQRLMRGGRWAAAAAEARAADPEDLLRAHRRHGHLWVLDRPGYPERLAEDPAPPVLLFGRGDPDLLAMPTVAIVGTRSCTGLGRDLAAAMGRELSAAGVAVASGLAAGIDAAGHRGAIDGVRAGGVGPIGVVASGLDIAYPRRNLALHREVADLGLLIGETVLGQRPTRWRFPARNRIIAGVSDAVVVVESRDGGGSMHTADEALGRGLPLLAVPGHPLGPSTQGTNGLLADGAAIARDAGDVLDALGLHRPDPSPGTGAGRAEPVGGVGSSVLRVLADGPASLAELVERTHEPFEELTLALLDLEVDGRIGRDGTWFELRARPAPAGGDA